MRQGLAIEGQFGLRPLEALVWVALTVEEGVYQPHAFLRTDEGLQFTLANPPLRTGAFESVRVLVDGSAVPAEQVELRCGPSAPSRSAASLSRTEPLLLGPGRPVDFRLTLPGLELGRRVTVRLEFQSVAIPPLVWLEFTDVPRRAGATA